MAISKQKKQSKSQKVAAAWMLLIMMGSTLAMATAPASAEVSVDSMVPADGAILAQSGTTKVTANVSGYENGFVKVNTTAEWGAGDFGQYTVPGPSGVQLRDISREDFSGTGAPDDTVWEWGDSASVAAGSLTLQSDSSNASLLQPYLRMQELQAPSDLSNQNGLVLTDQVVVTYVTNGAPVIGLGWWAISASSQPTAFGIGLQDNGTGGTYIGLWSSFAGNSPTYFEVPQGQTLDLMLNISDATAGTASATFTNLSGTFDLGSIATGTLSAGEPWVPFMGEPQPLPMGLGADVSMDVTFFEIAGEWTAWEGVYTSAPLDTGLFGGAHAEMIVFNSTRNAFTTVSDVSFASANAPGGPWTPMRSFQLNTAIDEPVDRYVMFEITMGRASLPSWPTNVEIHTGYHTDVGLYWYEDIPSSASGIALNPTSWDADTTALSGDGLQLSSASAASGAVGATYKNASWTLGSSNAFAGLAGVDITSASQASVGGDAVMLLAGAVATQGTAQAGYVGVVRECCVQSASPALWMVSNDGSTTTWVDSPAALTTDGGVVLRFSLANDVFSAWALEEGNLARGWVSLGSETLSAPAGSDVTLRFGSVGTSSSSQEAVLDWVAVKKHDMVAALGDEWESSGNLDLNEDLNTRAVIALSGPQISMQVSSYRHDTTPPVGAFTINGAAAGATSLVVNLDLAATDAWGIAFYAASESLSFPEGWKAYPSNGQATFLLSSGDARKVVWVRFMDTSGVISEPVNQTVFLDTVDPTGALYLNDRASTTSTADVSLTLLSFDAGGVDHAEVRNEGDASPTVIDMTDAGTPLQAVTKVIPWTLSSGDGVKTVNVVYFDAHGRSSGTPAYNASILLDSTAPSLTATLLNTISRDNTLYLNTTVATVRVSASDASGVETVKVSEDSTFATGRSYPTAGDLIYDLPAGSGARTLYVSALDVYGLVSTVVQIDFVVDVSPPTGSIVINGDAEVTTSRTVQLALTATDNIAVAQMQLSTSLYFLGSVWQPFASTASLDLSAGDGPQKTVYVRYRDVNGRESQAFFDTIALDTTPPSGFIIVNNGDVETIDRNLNLQLEAFDNFEGTLEMRVGTSADLSAVNWQPFSASFRIDAGTDAGNVTVYYQIRDINGLVSETYTDSIRVRLATCADTAEGCTPLQQPGFEAAYALVAVGLVAAVGVLGRRRRDL